MAIFRIPFDAMASACEVVLDAPDLASAQAQAAPAIDEVRRIEHTYSRYRPDSVVARINAAAGLDFVECDAETSFLLDLADQLYHASDALFDITSGVLRRAWDFRQARLPEPSALAALTALVGWDRVERRAGALRLASAGMEIDFGGFGKEYAADRAALALAAAGASSGYVNLAGDLRVIGPKPDGQPWMIGIRDPRAPGQLAARIAVASGGLATSGDYERYFELDGRRYCHVLDPRSGYPVQGWRSVSVCAPLALTAGACSTIAMLKQAHGLAFLNDSKLPFLAIDAGGQTHRSP